MALGLFEGVVCVFVTGARPLSLFLGSLALFTVLEAAMNFTSRISEDGTASDGEIIRRARAEARGLPVEPRPVTPRSESGPAMFWAIGIAFVLINLALVLFGH